LFLRNHKEPFAVALGVIFAREKYGFEEAERKLC
jgi:hypothetical protein